jgi:pimeloyl-ACP methyl ester carboxylesterase
MKLFFGDAEFDGQFQRTLAKAYDLGADLGECLAAAQRIKQAHYDSWYQEWWATAERAAQLAEACLAKGHRASAREAFLRASEYYRAAFFFCRRDLDDARLLSAWRNCRTCFRRAATLFDHPCETVDIPYEGVTLSGYFLSPGPAGKSRPTVICPSGYDDPVEEFYFLAAAPLLRRGYNCLIFEGPGQGGSLYEKRLYFRPDYEVVVAAAVDFALARRDVDPGRLVLLGRSFGGYLAPRAATGEQRLAALIADPGQMGPGVQIRKFLAPELLDKVTKDDPTADPLFDAMLQDPHKREFYGARMAAHGTATMRAWLRQLGAYTLEGREHLIRCPTLITFNDADFTGNTSRQLYEALQCPKQFLLFKDVQGAGGLCQGLGQMLFNQAAFDWLDDVLSQRSYTKSP